MPAIGFAILWNFQLQLYGFLTCNFRYFYLTTNKMIKLNEKQEGNLFLKTRTRLFLEIVKPFYKYYQEYLKSINTIDFNDMINQATDIIESEKIQLKYKYIIIDEYQDISVSRYTLIKSIQTKTKAKLMCVGDDWQSIYRFAGSDIQLFTKFNDFFGHSSMLKIENTYRNSQQLTDIAGSFVMKNPQQYKKDLKSNKNNIVPIRILRVKSSPPK